MTLEHFQQAVRDFAKAGEALVDAWDDGDGFNADEQFPLPSRLTPPISLDEWIVEFAAHYLEDSEAHR